MRDLRFAEAGGVVFERQLVCRWIDAEAPQAISVRELAELAQLLIGQGGLQFVSDFHEGHGGIIAAGQKSVVGLFGGRRAARSSAW